MSGINKVFLIGRLGRDPDDAVLPSGDPISNFSIAIDEKWKNKQGEPVEKTTWINVVAFAKLADICNKYLVKGAQVCICGKIDIKGYNSPKDPEGSPMRYATKIIASEMQMLGSKKENGVQTEQSIDAAARQHRNVKSGMDSMESLHGDNVKYDSDIPF